MQVRYHRRIQKELADFRTELPNVELEVDEATALHQWRVSFVCDEETVYAGERFTLQVTFDDGYPLEAPEVVFVGTPPVHPHVYSNGHLCLNILYDGWSPALRVTAIVLSILSMLSSCQKKETPPDNRTYIRNSQGKSPKRMRWLFHDDTV